MIESLGTPRWGPTPVDYTQAKNARSSSCTKGQDGGKSMVVMFGLGTGWLSVLGKFQMMKFWLGWGWRRGLVIGNLFFPLSYSILVRELL